MTVLKKWWPSIAHVGAVAVVFLAPSIRAYIGSHPTVAAPIAIAWGILLHWATSPKA